MNIGQLRTGELVVVEDDELLDLTAAASAAGLRLTLADVIGSPEALATVGRLRVDAPRRPLDGAELAAPVVKPSKVIAAPINYRDHQNEMTQRYDVSGLGVFLKAPSSVIGPGEQVRLPYIDRRFDNEGELALVIGAPARHVSPREAGRYILGYTCLLDITMRGGEDRSTRKSFDTFTPIGPWLVTPDAFDSHDAALRCWVNGELRQQANTADLIWDVEHLVSYASSVMTLLPGDVITTGTPAGVGAIDDGDEVTVAIEGIGALTVSVTTAGAIACPTRGAPTTPPPGRPAVPSPAA